MKLCVHDSGSIKPITSSVLSEGAACLVRVQRAQLRMQRAQLVVRWPVVRQARVKFPARHPSDVFLSERSNEEKGERPRRMDMNECTV